MPKEILSGENSIIKDAVYEMQEYEDVEIEINENYIRNNIINNQQDNSSNIEKQYTDYTAIFSAIAKKRFISLDRKNGNEYFGVARPNNFDAG